MVEIASAAQRQAIYRIRHEIYARELGQHAENAAGSLRDPLDDRNVYLVATVGGEVAGFVSVTPPVRLLSVLGAHRGKQLAALLMYAAFRWVESCGATHVVALGREEVLDLYLHAGLRATGETVRSGAVLYHLLHERIPAIRTAVARHAALLRRLERESEWRVSIPFAAAPGCYHGGAFFDAVGTSSTGSSGRAR